MTPSPKPRFVFIVLALIAGAVVFPTSADAGMICADLNLDSIDQWKLAEAPVEESKPQPEPNPADVPEQVDLADKPQDANCSPSDISTNSSPSSSALPISVRFYSPETSLAVPLVYTDPPVPASHLQRLFRPPRA